MNPVVFGMACDELNDALDDVEGAFAQHFKAPAEVPISDGSILRYMKRGGGGYGLFRVFNQDTTNLLSASLEFRTLVVDHLEELWTACEVAQDASLQRIKTATDAAKAFARSHTTGGIALTQPVGNCDGSGKFAYDPSKEDGRGPPLETPCPGCRACQ